ncbi:acyltransferase [uncultured Microbacterium sp.]|uniref:acyltransferase family protein n=1 Tax=uncultured Microbacterium sp. TaxID=191216 RepID=UPI0025E8AAC4|nr:acyltransferase [uncultured Microbacterium sp.]
MMLGMGHLGGSTTLGGDRRIAGLDLMRGLAVLLVLLCHSFPQVFGGGGVVGVVMFFALSGYLITALLDRDLRTHGRVRYGHFYRNRALRLLPALLLFLAVFTVITLVWDPAGERDRIGQMLAVSLTYTNNLPVIHQMGSVAHLWTLATEEQFYLLWPLLLTLGLAKRGRIWIIISIAAVVLYAVAAVSVWWAAPRGAYATIYVWPSSWAVAMLIGASGYLARERIARLLPAPSTSAGRTIAAVALALCLAASFWPTLDKTGFGQLLVGPVVAALSVIIIRHLMTWKTLPTVALRPLLALGTISYAAYLWNYGIVVWLGGNQPENFDLTAMIVAFVLTIIAAIGSWFLVEAHAARWRKRLDARQQTDRGARVTATV